MSKAISLVGSVSVTPLAGRAGSTRTVPLTSAYQAAQTLCETFNIAASVGSPFVIPGPLPAAMVAVRVISGGPVTVILTGPGGTDQAAQVTEYFFALSQRAPFTAVKVAGTASIEVLVTA